MLTKKQHKLLSYIKSYTGMHGFSPTYDEMKVEMEMKSKSSVFVMLRELEKKDYVIVLPLQKRSVIVRESDEFKIAEFGKDENFISIYEKNLDKLVDSFVASHYIFDRDKKYFGLVKHGFLNSRFKINPNEVLFFENNINPKIGDIILYYDCSKKMQLDYFMKGDIRKVVGILKMKVENYE